MGLFSNKSVDDTSRRYLAIAPPGARTEVVAAACTHQIRALPVAAAETFGKPIRPREFGFAVDLVRRIMVQDRDLSAHIARKAMQHLFVLTEDYIDGGNGGVIGGDSRSLDMLLDGVCLQWVNGQVAVRPSGDPAVSSDDVESLAAVARLAFAVFFARLLGPPKANEGGVRGIAKAGTDRFEEYRFYVELYTGAPGKDVESIAYNIIAWEAVAVGRLLNTGRIHPGMHAMESIYRTVPAMEVAGWYPNPQKLGGIVDGDAVLQRYWDGTNWTSKMRQRDGRRWIAHNLSLHDPPVN